MKQDLDFVRAVLLQIESQQNTLAPVSGKDLFQSLCAAHYLDNTDEGAAKLVYHIRLLMDDDLIEAHLQHFIGPGLPFFMVRRITADGHKYLAEVSSDSFYDQIKAYISEHKIPWTIQTVTAVATLLLKTMVPGL